MKCWHERRRQKQQRSKVVRRCEMVGLETSFCLQRSTRETTKMYALSEGMAEDRRM